MTQLFQLIPLEASAAQVLYRCMKHLKLEESYQLSHQSGIIFCSLILYSNFICGSSYWGRNVITEIKKTSYDLSLGNHKIINR